MKEQRWKSTKLKYKNEVKQLFNKLIQDNQNKIISHEKSDV